MNTAQAKAIPMKDLLARLGHAPHHEKNGELWYLSPFREEIEPSFKLTMNSKGWYDHGRGEGGNILDFAIAFGQVHGVGEALRWLEREWHGSRPLPLFSRATAPAPPGAPARQSAPPASDGPPIAVEKVQPLAHPALLGYLRSRGIAPDLARPYVQEIHYTRDGKRYFALAFANGSGGYELRNPYFKGTHGTKDITTLEIGQQATQEAPTAVFEGFFDFLTALIVNALPAPPVRVVVLNSTSMADRALERLREWRGPVHLFLDHDATGREHSAYFHAELSDHHVADRADLYAGHNDFNAMLIARQAHGR